MSSTRSESGDAAVAAPIARIALAALALAAVGALLIAQHIKHEPPLVIADAIWHPSQGKLDPRTTTATFSFQTHYRDEVTVSIVSTRTGQTVSAVARAYPVTPYRRTEQFRWNGRASNGALVGAGNYVVEVHFDHLDRTTQIPQVVFDVSYRAR
ncbi:MAG TPA: hypothetical protein VHM72_05260 [Solirubrobacteraceae bacterium]|nr:hypothetical protein [Solirubrobacteraceae bacterium]